MVINNYYHVDQDNPSFLSAWAVGVIAMAIKLWVYTSNSYTALIQTRCVPHLFATGYVAAPDTIATFDPLY